MSVWDDSLLRLKLEQEMMRKMSEEYYNSKKYYNSNWDKMEEKEFIRAFDKKARMEKKTMPKGKVTDIQAKRIQELEAALEGAKRAIAQYEKENKRLKGEAREFRTILDKRDEALEKSRKANSSILQRVAALQKALALRFDMVDLGVPGKALWIKLRGSSDNQILSLQSCFDKLFNDIGIVVTDETVETIRELTEEELKDLASFVFGEKEEDKSNKTKKTKKG